MKKIIALVLALCMVLALAACGGGSGTTGSTGGTEATTTQPAEGGNTEAAPAEVKGLTDAERKNEFIGSVPNSV